MPDILDEKHWDCPESAELNLWVTEFTQRRRAFEKKKDVGKPLDALFRSVSDIRHTAVHRIRVSARGMEQFVLDAELFATLLGDAGCLTSLTKLRRETQSVIEELERTKHVLSSKLDSTLKKIAEQRAELDRIREAAITEMVTQDGEYQLLASTNLEQFILSSEDITLTPTAKVNEGNSDVDDTDSVEDYGESSSTIREL